MEVSKENLLNSFSEVDLGSSVESFQRFLDSQKELLHTQIDQLQKIVVNQCKLTGVNPLSQEMAAGALSIKIGKRPRDLLNPKAVKYMQSVFSIKDNICKKELREISALCAVTVTQVKEFFAGQRSRVRRLVRLSREKTIRNNACEESPDGVSTTSDSAVAIGDHMPARPVVPQGTEEGPSCSSQDESIPSIDPSDMNFAENIFNLMRKEETFAGQVKLMEWILQIHDSTVLCWFLTKGGTMILATWLNQAALEEQTTVLIVIFKVLCHLPLHKALPVQMSAILQSVNRLRFYRTSDISNRARVLLSRWSKLFVRSQSVKRPSPKSPKDAQKEIIRRQRISEILSDESWQSKIDIPEEILALTGGNPEDYRNPELPRGLTLLQASSDDSNKKQVRSVSSPQTKERRKVLLVEQPGRKTSGRTVQITRVAPANQGRPMSADDIQKAKMRAIFMQSKYGKTNASSSKGTQQKTADPNRSSTSKTGNIFPASITLPPRREEDKRAAVASPVTSHTLTETSMPLKPSSSSLEPLWEKLKRARIPWQTPPEMVINILWSVSAGEKSKELEVQTERLHRGKETFYRTVHDIPSNPNEPWDIEMGFDDTLTPEIPIEQPPDADGAEVSSSPRNSGNTEYLSVTAAPAAPAVPAVISNGNPEPDLELLAVLLKNPQLVFALTSGQGNNGLTSADTVALLDLLKNSGIGLAGISNGLTENALEQPEITSMPSPTPSSDPPTSAWRAGSTYRPPQLSGNSISQPALPGNRSVTSFQAVTPSTSMTVSPRPEKLPVLSVQQAMVPPNPVSQDLLVTNSIASCSYQMPATGFPVPQISASSMPEKQLPTIIRAPQFPTTISTLQQTQISDPVLPANNFSITSSSPLLQNILAAGSPAQHLTMPSQEVFNFRQTHNQKPPSSTVFSNLEDKPGRLPPPPLLPNTPQPQPHLLPEPASFPPPLFPTWTNNAPKPASVPEFRSRPKSLLDAPPLNPQFSANQNNYDNYNVYPAGSTRQTPVLLGPSGDGNEYLGEPELEMWSPERSPVRSPDFHSGRNFPERRRNFSEQRRGYGRNHRHQRPRERNSGHRDHRAGNRRWRDRRY